MWKKRLVLGVVFALASVLLLSFSGSAQAQVSLGRGGRKHIEVDHQRVIFGHKYHQELSLRMAGNDPEVACKICHHKKRRGRDPRACRRCHAKRQVKAKGRDMCLTGCHEKAKRPDVDAAIKELPRKTARKGQLLKLKDAFHLNCKNCHSVLRAMSIDLDSTKYMAPILNCEGCHQAVKAEDKKKVEEERKKEKEMVGDVFEEIVKGLAGK